MTSRLPLGLTAATALALAILIGLGVWQLQRREWKTELLDQIAAVREAPAAPVGDVLRELARGGQADFRRVRAVCPGLSAAPWLEVHAIHEGQPGVRLVSACRLADAPYGSVLVDRGFVADTISARPPVYAADETPTTIEAVVRRFEPPGPFAPANTPARWFRRDTAEMAQALGAPDPAPVFLMAETSSNPEWRALQPLPVPTQVANRHLEYALTWFGLAAALLGVYAAMLWRRWKAQ